MHLADARPMGHRGQRDGDDDCLQVERCRRLVLDVDVALRARLAGPAVDGQRREAVVRCLDMSVEHV